MRLRLMRLFLTRLLDAGAGIWRAAPLLRVVRDVYRCFRGPNSILEFLALCDYEAGNGLDGVAGDVCLNNDRAMGGCWVSS